METQNHTHITPKVDMDIEMMETKDKIKGWKKCLESNKCIQFVRNNEDGIIGINYNSNSSYWSFSYFPLGENKTKYFVKENLTKSKALKLAKEYMKKITNENGN